MILDARTNFDARAIRRASSAASSLAEDALSR
jgi:hypothetical protein